MAREYSQKVALVTGGAQGIGRSIALYLAERGWRVAIADLKPGRDAGVYALRCDVAREPAVRACVRSVLARFGRLDALVNNAGVAQARTGPVEKLSVREWNRRIGVNLTGVFLMSKHAAPHLRRARGALVNIASTRALQSEPESEAYAAAKGGVVSLTHALAMTLGPRVRANCISPGWIDVLGGRISRADHLQHPAGRVGLPQDVAALTEFLLSERSAFITGQNFVIDGGMTKKMIWR